MMIALLTFMKSRKDDNSSRTTSYEISNHAADGHECRHNLTYWKAADWIGVGPGAHGRFAIFDPKQKNVCLALQPK